MRFRAAARAAALVVCLAGAAYPQTMTIERDVVVSGMTSDRFTWRDAANQPRVAVLAHNTGQTGPGGTRGGELREFRYQTPGGPRVVRASGTAFAGFGYVVSHNFDFNFCTGGGDPSSLGHFTPGQITRVFEGRHHAIFRFTQAYPRYCTTSAPAQQFNLPVTIEWVFASGRDNPVWAVTWDMSGVPVNRLRDDARGPYGELMFDGSATPGAHSVMAGVAWGDRFKFTSTANPVTYDSPWTWNVPNAVPYVKLWTTAVDATMGTVQTQTIVQQDAGGYWGVDRWGDTSAGGPGCTVQGGGKDHLMPCSFNWPYQSLNYELDPFNPGAPTNSTRLAWGTNFGFLGQAQYLIHGSQSYGGPLPDTFAPGHPRKSYSTHVVLGLHSADAVGDQVAEMEAVQATTLTAAVGSVATSGPAGVNRPDSVNYAPAGWNHVYGTWAVNAAAAGADVNFNVGPGRLLTRPVIAVSNWTAGTLPAVVRLNGAALVQDVDYFPSVRASAVQLWITLGRDLAGAANRLEVLPQTGAQLLEPAGMAVDPPSGGGNGVLEAGEQAVIAPSWRNVSAAAQSFFGQASAFGGPAGPGYNLTDNFADFGSIAPGATGSCLATGNCYVMAVFGARPVPHWDATFLDTPDNGNTPALRVLHVGESFSDVPVSNPFYRFVETLLHRGVTGGCGGGAYCPASATTREQMVVFVLIAKEGASYAPPACVAGAEAFSDVPASSPFCRWVEELARRGVVGGCGGGAFCPAATVTRDQLAVFVLATREPPGYAPPPCTAGAEMFADVPASSAYCRWIEELARRGVVSGCGGGGYCPASAVTREQMGVFLAQTFGLTLY
jgi:hypothetical protein